MDGISAALRIKCKGCMPSGAGRVVDRCAGAESDRLEAAAGRVRNDSDVLQIRGRLVRGGADEGNRDVALGRGKAANWGSSPDLRGQLSVSHPYHHRHRSHCCYHCLVAAILVQPRRTAATAHCILAGTASSLRMQRPRNRCCCGTAQSRLDLPLLE
ncbi:uncharacterized protein K441DRAFT_82272 [Cenococcum geophilum 1.58]|uniref:uncharacterized protein n=1 Tax=Cenococcum geophilum 1.58 TaxID=794803 RepID=UPI00358F6D16|nr:hypothetical protein K441DRAFT_82272 [Cenococcum geophilum 1.58]